MYSLTALYVYKAIFTLELLIAEFIMCTGLKHRPKFILRLISSNLICIGIAFAIPVLAYNAIYTSIVFLSLFIVTLFAIKFCYESNFISILFRGIAAYTTQHIAYQCFSLLMYIFTFFIGGSNFSSGMYGDGSLTQFVPIFVYTINNDIASLSPLIYYLTALFAYTTYFFVYILIYSLTYCSVSKALKNSSNLQLQNSSLFIFVICFVLFNVLISSIVTYYSEDHPDLFYFLLLAIYNVACSSFTLFLMFEVYYRKQYEKDYLNIQNLLKRSEEQYHSSKQNIEQINLKIHDLKHQIRALSTSKTVGSDTINELNNLLAVYDANIHTGNKPLDIIMTEKILNSRNFDITFNCLADGKQLDFIKESDLYSLFGNLLDNAIEAVQSLPKDHKFINVQVKRINDFPMISVSNFHMSKLSFNNGLPLTTKNDKNIHGYGMKSIRLICDKYNGDLLVEDKDNIFTVKIIFFR